MLSSDSKPGAALPTFIGDAKAGTAVSQPESVAQNTNEKDTPYLMHAQTTTTADIAYPSGLKLGLIMTSAFISMFLVSMVRTSTHLVSLRPKK